MDDEPRTMDGPGDEGDWLERLRRAIESAREHMKDWTPEERESFRYMLPDPPARSSSLSSERGESAR